MPKTKTTLLLLNGSIHGAKGNCAQLISYIEKEHGAQFDFRVVHLLTAKKSAIRTQLQQAQAIIALTGTYWESWGSPMQKFFEDFTDFETTELFMGKPCGAVALSHSVGGKSVLSRMLNTFNLFGCLIPPLAGLELSQVGQAALKSKVMGGARDDIWRKEDVAIILDNIRCVLANEKPKAWPVDTTDFREIWLR